MATDDKFNAPGALAGYLYQCRLALLLALQALKKKPNARISIEKFDDIAFETDNFAECIIQTKHSIAAKDLSDKSVDVWKTLGIWIHGFHSGFLNNADIKRLLITTAKAEPNSAMAMLRAGSQKDIKTAREQLRVIAKQSKNKITKSAREAFIKLNDKEADLLLGSIDVIDCSPQLHDVIDEIEGELTLLAPNHADKVAEALEGWWLKLIGRHLIGKGTEEISVQDLIKKANEIGIMYGPDKLPLASPTELGDKPYDPADEEEIYVKQMRLIGLSETVIHRGIRDYYRAYAQRSKWARENLLLDGETANYDAKLRDTWERRFDAHCSELSDSDENNKRLVGRTIFHWAQQEQIDFRNIVETWITAGSFQGLSDRLEVGWHPEYRLHLK